MEQVLKMMTIFFVLSLYMLYNCCTLNININLNFQNFVQLTLKTILLRIENCEEHSTKQACVQRNRQMYRSMGFCPLYDGNLQTFFYQRCTFSLRTSLPQGIQKALCNVYSYCKNSVQCIFNTRLWLNTKVVHFFSLNICILANTQGSSRTKT